jgi:hypothetical protein
MPGTPSDQLRTPRAESVDVSPTAMLIWSVDGAAEVGGAPSWAGADPFARCAWASCASALASSAMAMVHWFLTVLFDSRGQAGGGLVATDRAYALARGRVVQEGAVERRRVVCDALIIGIPKRDRERAALSRQ